MVIVVNIHKGEQFIIPFEVKIGDDLATPDNIDGLRIKIVDTMHEWPDGELSFDDENDVWEYPLAEAQSAAFLAGTRKAQVAVRIGDVILKTDVFQLNVKDSIITERWDNDG